MMDDLFRHALQPLLGLERRDWVGRLLAGVLIGAMLANGLYFVIRLAYGESILSPSVIVNLGLLVIQFGLLFAVWRGYFRETAVVLVASTWVGMTYNAWNGEGVHDSAIVVYLLVVFACALVMNWRVAIVLTILSVVSIWGLAIGETTGRYTPRFDSPMGKAWELSTIFLFAIVLIYMIAYTVRRSNLAMKESEEWFRRIFHVSPVAISIIDLLTGKLLNANDAYWKLTGLNPQTSLGKATFDLGLWINENGHRMFMEAILKQKTFHFPEFEFINANGVKRITAVFHELIESEEETTVLSMFYDMTDQVNAQRALSASEEKYKNFVKTSTEGIWFLAFDEPIPTDLPDEEQVRLMQRSGYIQDCNETFAHMYGYSSRNEILGKRLLDLYGGETNEVNFQATLDLVRSNYRTSDRETVEKAVDGRTLYFLNSAVGVLKDDELTGVWGTQLDITALKNTQDALQRSETRLRALLEATPDLIFEIDRTGNILQFVSSSIMDTLLPPEQFLSRNISDVMPQDVVDQTMFAIERTLETGLLQVFEYQLPAMDDQRYFEASITRNEPDTVIAMVRDVTVRKWAATEREKLIDELETKNAELEQFTYTVSHDLKSPLITIRGFMGFVMEDVRTGNMERLEADMKRIRDATEKMHKLLGDLLELSRVGRLINEPVRVDMNRLVAEVIELVQGRIVQGNVQIQVAPNLPYVQVDRQRIFEVLQNLIDNAAKFMGDQPNPVIEIGHNGQFNGMPIFYVKDNGIGISSEFKERIFGLFNKLDARTDGTGIGLALVKRIIEYHNGKIWVDSELGHGATFFFALPPSPKPVEAPE